jgi:two-component system, LuxR family, response regulator FixJ
MAALGGRRVYVIDDDQGVLESTAFLLAALGFECRTFASARSFLEQAPKLPRGCVLTDLRMPEMDGVALAADLQSQGLGWPVLLMTSDNGPQLARRAAGEGFAAVLRKPVDGAVLEDALSRAFSMLEA